MLERIALAATLIMLLPIIIPVVVIVNNDKQCRLKKGESFMNEKDRLEIVFALGIVDEVLISSDTDVQFVNHSKW